MGNIYRVKTNTKPNITYYVKWVVKKVQNCEIGTAYYIL